MTVLPPKIIPEHVPPHDCSNRELLHNGLGYTRFQCNTLWKSRYFQPLRSSDLATCIGSTCSLQGGVAVTDCCTPGRAVCMVSVGDANGSGCTYNQGCVTPDHPQKSASPDRGGSLNGDSAAWSDRYFRCRNPVGCYEKKRQVWQTEFPISVANTTLPAPRVW